MTLFLILLTETHVCWKITTRDGKSALMVPVNEIPPVPEEIQDEVEDFRRKFLENVGAPDAS